MTSSELTPGDRRRLRDALQLAYPWLQDTEVGPRSVSAGECERCGRAPRMVATCGPVAWEALCPTCANELGEGAWCDGHAEDGERALATLAALPPEWELVARLWWVATGEARLDTLVVRRPEELPAAVREALP